MISISSCSHNTCSPSSKRPNASRRLSRFSPALRGLRCVIREYPSDSSSKRPDSSVLFGPPRTGPPIPAGSFHFAKIPTDGVSLHIRCKRHDGRQARITLPPTFTPGPSAPSSRPRRAPPRLPASSSRAAASVRLVPDPLESEGFLDEYDELHVIVRHGSNWLQARPYGTLEETGSRRFAGGRVVRRLCTTEEPSLGSGIPHRMATASPPNSCHLGRDVSRRLRFTRNVGRRVPAPTPQREELRYVRFEHATGIIRGVAFGPFSYVGDARELLVGNDLPSSMT